MGRRGQRGKRGLDQEGAYDYLGPEFREEVLDLGAPRRQWGRRQRLGPGCPEVYRPLREDKPGIPGLQQAGLQELTEKV